MREFWTSLTDFGDSAVLLPVAAIVAALLWRAGATAALAAWARSLALCIAAIGLLKLVFSACGQAIGGDVASPSGHTALAATVIGGLAILVARPLGAAARAAALASGGLLALAIGWSRVAIGAHNAAEVAIGLAVGAGAIALFQHGFARAPRPALSPALLLAAAAGVAVALHGERLHAEQLIHSVAQALRLDAHLCAAPASRPARRVGAVENAAPAAYRPRAWHAEVAQG